MWLGWPFDAQEDMSLTQKFIAPSLTLGAILLSAGCSTPSSGHELAPIPISNGATKKTAPMERVSDRKGNTMGTVFVAEYHQFKAGRGEMFRTPKQFRNDLETFYKAGFRPVLASEFLANKMPLPPGASPVVMTFDDSSPTQLQLKPDGTVDPNCAVGIWQAFAKEHPDFPVHGTFFVLPDNLWSNRKNDPRKIKLIFELGSEIANHTIHHPQLKRLSDEKVKWELGTANEKLEALGQKMPVSMALPFGISPKNKALLKGFDWNGGHTAFTGVFLSGAEPAKSPNNPKFNSLRVPRILATTVPFGLDYWFKELKAGRVKPYVQP